MTAASYSIWSYVLLFMLLVAFPVMASRNGRIKNVDSIPRISIYVSSCAVLWALFVFAILVLEIEGAPMTSLGFAFNPSWTATASWTLILLSASLMIAYVAQRIRDANHNPTPPILERIIPETPREILVYLLLVCTTAGIAEEVLFRAFAITRLAPLVGSEWVALAVAAVCFGLAHSYQGVLGMVSTGLIGLGYGLAFLMTGTLDAPIIAHMLHNAASAFLFKPR